MDRCARCGMEQGMGLAGLCPKCLLTRALGSESSLEGLEETYCPLPPVAEGKEAEPEWSAPGTLLAGRYTVLGMSGQGGMGVVLAAYDARLDRRVALKLLRPGRTAGNAELETRLVREAQAMARLNHPHVVQVYDSGHLEDGSLFIAMEYVEGQTLRSWCEARRRPWREVLEAYLAAGRGLVAAHEAGLIHRDFKPDNVLVGRDGRVRVTDFGLARLELSAPPAPEAERSGPLAPGAWRGVLTRSGWLLGTPLYMAPELLRGRTADVRSDLFAFCVSLHESLHGQPPFVEDSSGRGLFGRKLAPPPEGSEVPDWVTRVVYQGLQEEPERRPASLGALLAALEDDPERKRRTRRQVVVPLAVGAVLLLPLVLWGWMSPREPGCELQAERLAGVWDGAVKARVERALLGTGLAYAPDSAGRVSAALDGYARTWVGMRTAVCEAVRARDGVPGGRTLLEEHCLERRLGQMRAFTELLERGPDPLLLPKVVQAVHSLPSLEDCRGERVLMEAVSLPEEPTLREKVKHLWDRLDRLEALSLAGRYKEGLALHEELWRQIEPVEHVPLQAHALWWRARLQEAAGSYQEAERSAERALELSIRGGGVTQVSQAWSVLALIKGVRQSHFQLQEVLLLDKTLESLSAVSRDDRHRISALNTRASMFLTRAKYEEARQRLERALALAERVLEPEHPLLLVLLNNLGFTYKNLGRYEEAKRSYTRALELRRKAFGPEHPEVASSLSNLGALLSAEGQYEEARAKQEQALALMKRVLGPEHPNVTLALNSLAGVLHALGRYEEAAARFEQVRVRLERQYGAEHSTGIIVHINQCMVLADVGRYEEARAKCERALALGGEAGPKHHMALAHHYLGRVLAGLGQYAQSRTRYARALAMLEEELGPKHPDCVHPLLGLADLHLARGRPVQALALLERAEALAAPSERREVHFSLVRALWESGRERERARELATGLLRHYQGLGHPKRDEVARWLASHPQS